MKDIKLVFVGDGEVGKTCLLMSHKTNTFPQTSIPKVCDHYTADVVWNDTSYSVGLWDTAGQDEYKRLRPLCYIDTNVFVICFSIASPDSLEGVNTRWVPEIKKYCPDVPYILVGCKMDLREDAATLQSLKAKKLVPVTTEQGQAMAKQVGAVKYVECSALTQQNLKKVIDEAIAAKDGGLNSALFALLKQAKNKPSNMAALAKYVVEHNVDLSTLSITVPEMIFALMDSNVPVELVKAILAKCDKVNSDLLQALCRSNELFPSAFAQYEIDLGEIADIVRAATPENASLVAQKLTQEQIDAELDYWSAKCLPLVMALVRSNRVSLNEEQFQNLLNAAYKREYIEIIEELLKMGKTFPAVILFDSVQDHKGAMLRMLVKYMNVNVKNDDKQPLVIFAICRGNASDFKILLETNQCDMNMQDEDGNDAHYHLAENDDMRKVYEEYKNDKRMAEQQQTISNLQSTVDDLKTKIQSMDEKLALILKLLQK